MSMLNTILGAKSRFFNVDKNPILKWVLTKSFYSQFCAGEQDIEVRKTLDSLKSQGFAGVILEYGAEVIAEDTADYSRDNIGSWRRGILETINMTQEGDCVGFKWSGMGNEALRLLKANEKPSGRVEEAVKDVCDAATAKSVALLPAAEPQHANPAVDAWNLMLSKQYNRNGRTVIYNTYQCYLKSTPSTLARHLGNASQEGFNLGIKLVRGAYLHSEPRHLIWETKSKTDQVYDDIAEFLVKSDHSTPIPFTSTNATPFPAISVCLATHNEESVKKVEKLRKTQVQTGKPLINLSYAQLQGMADEVSCRLLQTARLANDMPGIEDVPKVYKGISWGPIGLCLNYLLRRAAENKEAVERTVTTKVAMRQELWRRIARGFS
ncbi:MAG: proline dehydrogenase [Alyxoria varia]|nr:MAG: proline dehydrogenase [Alyxoria varia]